MRLPSSSAQTIVKVSEVNRADRVLRRKWKDVGEFALLVLPVNCS